MSLPLKTDWRTTDDRSSINLHESETKLLIAQLMCLLITLFIHSFIYHLFIYLFIYGHFVFYVKFRSNKRQVRLAVIGCNIRLGWLWLAVQKEFTGSQDSGFISSETATRNHIINTEETRSQTTSESGLNLGHLVSANQNLTLVVTLFVFDVIFCCFPFFTCLSLSVQLIGLLVNYIIN